jgi:hypothetical protein
MPNREGEITTDIRIQVHSATLRQLKHGCGREDLLDRCVHESVVDTHTRPESPKPQHSILVDDGDLDRGRIPFLDNRWDPRIKGCPEAVRAFEDGHLSPR